MVLTKAQKRPINPTKQNSSTRNCATWHTRLRMAGDVKKRVPTLSSKEGERRGDGQTMLSCSNFLHFTVIVSLFELLKSFS